MTLLTKLVVESNQDGSYTLHQDMTYYRGWMNSDDRCTVRKGFTYDMSSIPRLLWRLIPKDDRHFRRASAFHDHGYRYQLGKKRSDMLMDEIAKVDGAPWLKRYAVMAGLKAGGWLAYRNHTKAHGARLQGFEAQRFNENFSANPYHKDLDERRWWNWGWMYARDHPNDEYRITGNIPMKLNGISR